MASISSLGLGDEIIVSGAAVYASKRYDKVRVWCHRHYLKSVTSFYQDCPNIVVTVTDEHPDTSADVVLIGEKERDIPCGGESMQQWYYRLMGIPLKERWLSCPIASATKKVPQRYWPPGMPLVHDDISRGREITRLPEKFLRVKDDGESILNLAHAIESAPEIHVMDSCIFHLAECLQPSGKLYLHRYPHRFSPGWIEQHSKHNWNLIY